MFYPLHARHVLAIGLAVLALSGAAAKADVIYTVTATGTINSGLDNAGYFGVYGANLYGDAFSITQTFDASTAGIVYSDYISNSLSGAMITIGTSSYAISANTQNNNYYFINSGSAGNIYAQTVSAAGYPFLDVFATLPMASNDLSQVGAFSISGSNNYFELGGIETIYGTVSKIYLNEPAPTPEPASLGLFGAGLVCLAWLRRRKAV